MKKFDYISDVHIDFWISKINNQRKCKEYIELFINDILPENKSEVLIIAGDISNSNNISKLFLDKISEYYELVLLVWGNHDFYLDSKNMKSKYKNNSFNKIKELEEFISSNFENVKILNGNIISYKGVNYGGTGMWYDLKYSIREGKMDEDGVWDYFTSKSNDYVCIKGLLQKSHFKSELLKLENIFNGDVDVIVTHVVPDVELIKNEIDGKYNEEKDLNMYVFDASHLMEKAKGKVWIYGHSHGESINILNEVSFLRNCVGYPKLKNGKIISVPNKIKTYVIEKNN